MHAQNSGWFRGGATALGLSGLLFATFPIVRPFYTDLALDPNGAALTISSPLWVVSHLMLIVALVLLPFGLLTVFVELESNRVRRLALIGVVLGIAGGGLFLPVAGVEAFALPAIARQYLQGQTVSLEAIVAAHTALQATVLVPALAMLGLGGVFIATAVGRSGRFSRWVGIPFALGLMFFLPLLPQPIRIIDGVLIGIGALGLAWALWQGRSETTAAVPLRHRTRTRRTSELRNHALAKDLDRLERPL